jgi:uncharacterized protein
MPCEGEYDATVHPQPPRRSPHRSCVLLALLLPLAVAALSAESLSSIPNPRTRDGTWVTDMPRALRAETVAQLNTTIGELERTNGAELAVVVVSSLDGLSVEEAAVRLFELWGIGKKGQDNGLLLLWSTGDRRVRVEVGYGLEGALPDGKVGAILDTYVIPKFKAGDFDQGILDGVDALIRVIRAEPVALLSAKSDSYERPWAIGSIAAGIGGSLAALIGTITGVRRWRRYRRRRCPACQSWMIRLDEAEDDASLADGQRAEERVGSVDYDVWKCGACGHTFTLRYPRWLTPYAACPQCHNRTKSATETVLVAATTSSSGSAQVVEQCAFCNFHREYTKTLPRIQESSSSGSSSSGGGSSFGGGGSGGGGASRGY